MNNCQDLFKYYALLHSHFENILSDLIWSYSQCDKEFMKKFFIFCFPNSNKVEPVNIYREVPYNDNVRNDFHFATSNGLYILESKIDDHKLNLKKYIVENCIPKDKITYILRSKNTFKDEIEQLEKDGIYYVFWDNFAKSCSIDYPDIMDVINIMIRNYKGIPDNIVNEQIEQITKFTKMKYPDCCKKNDDRETLRTFGFYIDSNETSWIGLRVLYSTHMVVCSYGLKVARRVDITRFQFKYLRPCGYWDEYGFTYFEFDIKNIESAYSEFEDLKSKLK